MKSKSKPQKNSPQPWKQKLLAVMELKRQAAQNAYQRVQLLCAIYDDPDFRADHPDLDDHGLAERLNPYVDDLQFPFLSLRALLEEFPEEGQWGTQIISQLWEDYQQNREDARKKTSEEQGKRTRRVVTQAQYRELEDENRRLKVQIRQLHPLEGEVDTLRKELREARVRISELEEENAQLRKQLDSQLQTV